MTIADLKVGARLIFGSYGVSEASIHPITWLKAGKNGEFLSEYVLDILKFDNMELENPDRNMCWNGNGDYEVSNIIQFLNSRDEDWYEPMHQYDSPPGHFATDRDGVGDYLHHAGFLYNFDDYELECLSGRIDLPTVANIYGTGREAKFQLFNRKGYRGKPTTDLLYNRYGHGLSEGSFCEFWVGDTVGRYTADYIDRGGSRRTSYASSRHGVRPKCMLKLDTIVEKMPDESDFRIVPFTASNPRTSTICTDEEFMSFMGLL